MKCLPDNEFREDGEGNFMNKWVVFFSIIISLMAGCSSQIIAFKDNDTDAEILRTRMNRLSGGISFVTLNAQRFEKGDDISYTLFVVYAGPSFLNIESGRSLVVFIDGQRHEFTGKGSSDHRNVVSLGLVEEKAYYHDIDPDVIRQLAYAKKVEIVVKGSSDSMKRHFNGSHIATFREFYDYSVERVAVSN